MKNTDTINLPDELYEKWDSFQYYRITNTHLILSATKKENGVSRILNLIPEQFFAEKLWKTLFHLSDEFLLLPVKTSFIDDIHILEFPFHTSLKNLVQTEGLSLSRIIQLISDLTNSLNSLHAAGILHMDISADNIFFTEDHRFILGDFSESCFLDTVGLSKKQTPNMSAPECLTEPPTLLSEQYSLGILFYLLCNHGNCPGEDFCGDIPPNLPVLQAVPELAENIISILSKMLAQTPAERYPDLSYLQQDLQELYSLCPEDTPYHLFIPDEIHAFHQTVTLDVVKTEDKAKTFLPYVPFLALILFIFIGLFFIKTDKAVYKKDTTKKISKVTSTHISTSPGLSIPQKTPETCNTILDIGNQNFSSLAQACSDSPQLNNIQILLAENNQFTRMDEISSMPKLEEAYLSNNQITDTDSFIYLPELKTLILSDNHCDSVSGLATLNQLLFLDLSGNHELTDILELQNLKNLQMLILSDTSVPKDLIQKLQTLLPECTIIY